MSSRKVIKYLPNLAGRLLVFGGAYSNLQALESLQAIAVEQGIPPHRIICTGDVVGYCAQPEEAVQLIKNWGIHCIAGNVEIQLREGAEACGCNFNENSRCDRLSQQWYPYAKNHLSQDSIEWMKTLPDFLHFTFADQQVFVVHGSYFETAEFIFSSTPWDRKAANFSATQTNVILAGHCGLPFHQQQSGQLWFNPGVIGMPANDGTSRVWFGILEDQPTLQFTHHAYTYDHLKAQSLMQSAGLPKEYAQTLTDGLWDNCEILPTTETAARGVLLELEDKMGLLQV